MSSKRSAFLILLFILIIPIHVLALQTTVIGSISEEGTAEIQSRFDSSGIPSVQAAIVINDTLWAEGYGEQPNLDTIYRTGSVTKTFVAAAFVKLYEEGIIDLDDDVSDYLPFQVRNPNEPATVLTIRMFLQHNAGMSLLYQFDQPWYDPALYQWELDNGFTPGIDEVEWNGIRRPLHDIINSTNINDPDAWGLHTGTGEYSNTGYFFLSFLLEHITNDTWSKYIQDHILVPLGMDDTAFNITETSNPIAIPHLLHSNGTVLPVPLYQDYGYGAGAMMTTSADVAKFLIAIINDGMYEEVQVFQPENVPLVKQFIQSGGSIVGYSARINTFEGEDREIGLVLLANGPGGYESIWSAILKEAAGGTTTTTPTLPGPGPSDLTTLLIVSSLAVVAVVVIVIIVKRRQ